MRANRAFTILAAAVLVSGWLGSTAAAQEAETFNAQNFKPCVDPYGYMNTNGSRVLEPWHWHASAWVNYESRPIRFAPNASLPGGKDIINDITTLDIVASLGLLKVLEHGGLEVGIDVPIVLDGAGISVKTSNHTVHTAGFGAVRPVVKLTLSDRDKDFVGFGVEAFAELATAPEKALLTYNEHWSAGATMFLEKRFFRIFRVGGELGYQWIQGKVQIGDLTIDDKVLLGAAVGLAPLPEIPAEIVAEVHQELRETNLFREERERPAEIGGGIKYYGIVFAMLGASTGLNVGVGAPDYRIFGAVGVTF